MRLAPHRVSVAILALVLLFLAALVGMRVDSLLDDRDAAIARAEAGMRSLTGAAEQYAQRVFETSALVADQVARRIEAEGGVAALRDKPGRRRTGCATWPTARSATT